MSGAIGPDAVSGAGSGAPVTWGLFGGTFDPVHYAHLAVAEQTRERLGLAGVLFVPAAAPPHKPGRPISAGRHRLAMLELATAGNPAFRVSRIELDRPGPSYTVDTVASLLADPPADLLRPATPDVSRAPGLAVMPAASGTGHSAPAPRLELVLILSAEALRLLPEWHEPDRLLALCRVAVVPRHGYGSVPDEWLTRHFPGRQGRFILLDGPDLGNSASEIRTRERDGRSIRYLVPPEVEAYIRDHGLYTGSWPDEPARPGAAP